MDVNPKIVELTDENVCKICNNRHGKYTCPRCNVFYCSLDCYKSQVHSECSEHFYRDFVMSEMQIPSEMEQNKIYEILTRMNNENEGYDDDSSMANDTNTDEMDSDDDVMQELKERMDQVDLNNTDLVWTKLTDDEKQEFEALVQSGDVTNLVPKWQPWWLYRKPASLVQDINQVDFDYKTVCPTIIPVIEFRKISKTFPADCVKYNIVNVLAAYAFVTRYFNGDHFHFLFESANILIDLASNLRSNANYFNVPSALMAVEIDAGNCSRTTFDVENIKLMQDDSRCILNGPNEKDASYYAQVALSEIHNLLSACKTSTKNITASVGKSDFSLKFNDMQAAADINKNQMKLHIKKIEYYLSYTKTYGIVT